MIADPGYDDKKLYEYRNMFVAERILSSIVNEYGEHPVTTDGDGP